MDRLYTPWRYAYVTGQIQESGCVFCNRLECAEQEHYILHRGRHWYIVLNLYPYNNGHMLLVLNRHAQTLSECQPDELAEMAPLLWLMETALRRVMNPDGINGGYNGGISAGAGIPEHLHLHLLPRWSSDTNFMSSIGDTRVMPQTLTESYRQLAPVIAELAAELA